MTAASDLYSVGVILYELLTGVVPFEGETAVAIAFKQVSAEPRPPSALNLRSRHRSTRSSCARSPRIPPQRYADADELIAALNTSASALPALAARAAPPDGYAPAERLRRAAGWLLAAPAPARTQSRRIRRRRRRGAAAGARVVPGGRCSSRRAPAACLCSAARATVTVPEVTGQSEQAAGADAACGRSDACAVAACRA